MILINTSCRDEACKLVSVLRVSNDESENIDVFIVLIKGSHIQVYEDLGSGRQEDDSHSHHAMFCFEMDIFGDVWDMQVVRLLLGSCTCSIPKLTKEIYAGIHVRSTGTDWEHIAARREPIARAIVQAKTRRRAPFRPARPELRLWISHGPRT